jgi:hypothetical protein
MQFTPEQNTQFGQVGGKNIDFNAIQNMNPSQFNQFKNDLNRDQRNMLREYNAFSIYDNN